MTTTSRPALGAPAARVADALDISRRCVAKIRQNLFWAFAYNTIGIPMAALGLFGEYGPLIAAVANIVSGREFPGTKIPAE